MRGKFSFNSMSPFGTADPGGTLLIRSFSDYSEGMGKIFPIWYTRSRVATDTICKEVSQNSPNFGDVDVNVS